MANAFYTEFGQRLRKVRKDADLSQDDLAQRVGLSRTSITNIELGRQQVALHMLHRFAAALGVQPMKLIPTELSPESPPDLLKPQQLERARITHEGDVQGWVERIVTSTRSKKDS